MEKLVFVPEGSRIWRWTYHLVDDIPGVNLALVAAHQLVDVVLHNGGQGGLVPDLRDPAGQLGVPHGSVTADELAIVLCELGGLVCGAEGERTTLGLDGIPLHAVRQLAPQKHIAFVGAKRLTSSPV